MRYVVLYGICTLQVLQFYISSYHAGLEKGPTHCFGLGLVPSVREWGWKEQAKRSCSKGTIAALTAVQVKSF